MKRFLSALLVFSMLGTLLPGAAVFAASEPNSVVYSSLEFKNSELDHLPSVPNFEPAFLPAGSAWNTLRADQAPASFKEVSYTLAEGVVLLENQAISDKIASAGQLLAGSFTQDKAPEKIIREGGFIQRQVLDTALATFGKNAKPGLVLIDPQASTAFKISSSTAFANGYGDAKLDAQTQALENTYMIEQPQIDEVFADFSLGGNAGESVTLTRGNITGFAPGVESCLVPDNALQTMSIGDALKDYQDLTGDKLIDLQFTDKELKATGSGGKELTVRLSGGLGISDITVDARYTKFKGYHLIMDVAEEFYLVVEVQGEIKEEIRIPLLGLDIPFGIGRVAGGLFLVVGLDGNLMIEAEAREYASVRMGVRGKTSFGIPVSVKGVFEKEFKKDGEVDIAGQINGYLKCGPLLDISLFGIDLIGAGAFAGIGLGVKKEDSILDINLYASLQVYFKIVGKTVNLIHWTPSLLHKRQQDTAGYRVHIEEAYIKIGRVGGFLEKTDSVNKSRVPPGINYRIVVYPAGIDPQTADTAKLRYYPKDTWQQTSEEGEFFYGEDPTMLSGGDQVALQFQIGQETFTSDPVPATFPYDKVTITEADYFNDVVTGSVAPAKVINYSAQQVSKPGDPADAPNKQYELRYYTGTIQLQGLRGQMMTAQATSLTKEHAFFLKFPQGGIVTLQTDKSGNFDSRNPDMLPDEQYDPVYNGELQIRPGAIVQGDGTFDYSKNHSITAVQVIFNVTELEHVSSHTILVNPTLPLSVTRTISYVDGSYIRSEQEGKIVDQMCYDETVNIVNDGGSRAVTAEEVLEFFEEGWTTQDVIGFKNGKFLGQDDAPILSHTVSGGGFEVKPILDENGQPTSSVSVNNRLILEWVWQEHPLPTRITSPDNASLEAGQSFTAQGSGIQPMVWRLQDAPQGISIDPVSGVLSVAPEVEGNSYTFKVRLEQDPLYFQTAVQQVPPGSNASFSFGFTKTDITAINDFYQHNKLNPAMPDGPINYIGHFPADGAEQNFTLTVKERPVQQPVEPPLSAPTILDARHGYRFSLTAGESDQSIALFASGSAPITWSLIPSQERALPAEITIDSATGRLNLQKSLAPGTYPFVIQAQNALGSDVQNAVVAVSQALVAPIIVEEAHGFRFSKLVGGGDLVLALSASGSAPITWSVKAKSERQIVPPQVTIDPTSGVLTVKEGIEPGEYVFLVLAQNSVGSDNRECVLKVVSTVLPPILPVLPDPTGNTGERLFLSTNPGLSTIDPAQLPVNSTTIRVDHVKDRYTFDRNVINGAEFIRWNSVFKLDIEGSPEEVRFEKETQKCDSYHIYIDMTDPELQHIVTDMGKRIQDIKNAQGRLGAYLLEQSDRFVTNPWTEGIGEISGLEGQTALFDFAALQNLSESTYLDYGMTVKAIQANKGGAYDVALGGISGTVVTGQYFTAIQANPSASLSFTQQGATITFSGKDVKDASAEAMFDVGFSALAEHGQDMTRALAQGERAFTYSFAGHGKLPGLATFAISTDLAEGTSVNVYKYDAPTQQFSLIAGNVAVQSAGVVTYKNNTMSEYLITPQTITGAAISDISKQQDAAGAGPPMLMIGLGLAGVVIVVVLWLFLRRKQKTPLSG